MPARPLAVMVSGSGRQGPPGDSGVGRALGLSGLGCPVAGTSPGQGIFRVTKALGKLWWLESVPGSSRVHTGPEGKVEGGIPQGL